MVFEQLLQNGVCNACLTRMLEAVLNTRYSILDTQYSVLYTLYLFRLDGLACQWGERRARFFIGRTASVCNSPTEERRQWLQLRFSRAVSSYATHLPNATLTTKKSHYGAIFFAYIGKK